MFGFVFIFVLIHNSGVKVTVAAVIGDDLLNRFSELEASGQVKNFEGIQHISLFG
jgi:hypothetical protein